MLPHSVIHFTGAQLAQEDFMENSEQGFSGKRVEANRGSCLGEGQGIENSGAEPLSSEIGKKPTLFSGVPKPTIPNEQWQRTMCDSF